LTAADTPAFTRPPEPEAAAMVISSTPENVTIAIQVSREMLGSSNDLSFYVR
jgi:hypothetical protein